MEGLLYTYFGMRENIKSKATHEHHFLDSRGHVGLAGFVVFGIAKRTESQSSWWQTIKPVEGMV